MFCQSPHGIIKVTKQSMEEKKMSIQNQQFSYAAYPGNFPGQSGIPEYSGFPGFPGNFPGNSGTHDFPGYPELPPYWGGWRPYETQNQNLPDAQVGGSDCFGAPWLRKDVRGYGIDLDGNGRYDRGTDGVLAFDFNHDGKLEDGEIKKSNTILKTMGGNYDLNGDGKVSWWERRRGEQLRKEGEKFDSNHDGVLEADELDRAGAKVGIDRNGDGTFSAHETHSVYNFPTPWFGRGSIDYVDPSCNYSQVSYNNPWFPPFPWQPSPQPQPMPWQPEPPIGIMPDPIMYQPQQQAW
jgi:hypothetical protein